MELIDWIFIVVSSGLTIMLLVAAFKNFLYKNKVESKHIDNIVAMRQKYDILKQEEGKSLHVNDKGEIEKR